MSARLADVTVEIATTPDRLEAAGPAWDALGRRAGGSVFQSRDWVAGTWVAGTWVAGTRAAETNGVETNGAKLRVALAWRGDALVGVLPLAVRRRRGLRILGWAGEDHTDYCDALLDPALDRDMLVGRLWSGTVRAGGYDVVHLTHMKPDAAVLPVLSGSSPRLRSPLRGTPHDRRDVNLRVRRDWPSGDAWLQALSKKPRQNYKRGRKTLAESGPVAFRVLGPAEPTGPVLDRLVALKRDWLVRQGLTSAVLENDAAILRAAVGALARAGLLRLFVLECAGEVVAGSVNFVEDGRMMAFFAAYDFRHERASLGTVLMADYLMWAFDAGLDEVDFLCGAEEYKFRFANVEHGLASLVGARTPLGHAALALRGAMKAFRAWRSRPVASRPVTAAVLGPGATVQAWPTLSSNLPSPS